MYNIVYQKLPSRLKKYHAEDASPLKCDHLSKNKIFFYFGASSDMFLNTFKPHKKAYGNIENSGVGKTDKDGNAVIYLKCPQVYENTDGNVYPRHFHVFYWNEKKEEWDPKLHTYDYPCTISTSKMKEDSTRFKIVKDIINPADFEKCKKTSAILLCGTVEENDKRAEALYKLGFMNIFFHNPPIKSKSKKVKILKGGVSIEEILKLNLTNPEFEAMDINENPISSYHPEVMKKNLRNLLM
jgi:hypothetical protein